jgi:site-specific DNA-cytosine methylase
LFAREAWFEVARRGYGVEIKSRYISGSEAPGAAGEAARKFLLLNHKPEIMCTDMCNRTREGRGFDHYSKQWLRPDAPDDYAAGFECKDITMANTANPKALDETLTPTSGRSTRTLHASLEFIMLFLPPAVLLENVWRPGIIPIIRRLFKLKLPMYACCVFAVDSINFGVGTCRKRTIIIGVNLSKATIVRPMTAWGRTLRSIAAKMRAAQPPTDSYLLPDTHIEVTSLASAMVDRGRPWAKSRQRHSAVRARLARVLKAKIPPPRGLPPMEDGTNSEWLQKLTRRSRDVLFLHILIAVRLLGTSPRKHSLVWDLHTNINFTRYKNVFMAGVVPTIQCSHVYWHTARQRVLTGLELLFRQGFSQGRSAQVASNTARPFPIRALRSCSRIVNSHTWPETPSPWRCWQRCGQLCTALSSSTLPVQRLVSQCSTISSVSALCTSYSARQIGTTRHMIRYDLKLQPGSPNQTEAPSGQRGPRSVQRQRCEELLRTDSPNAAAISRIGGVPHLVRHMRCGVSREAQGSGIGDVGHRPAGI